MTPAPTAALATLVLRVTLPFAAGYFLSYLYRTVNAVLAPEIAKAIPLEAADVGLMTGVYFITFASTQLPLGILLDRYGPRRVESILLAFAALGAAVFAMAQSIPALVLGRALVGFGVSACLMAALKANVLFFPPQRLALMNGVILGAGGLGALAATAPVQAALAVTDWRGVYGAVAALTLLAGLALWLTVPARGEGGTAPTLAAQLRDVATIFKTPMFWRVAPATMLATGSFMAVQGLWAGPWFRDICAMSPEQAAGGLTVMAGAMAVGFLSVGAMSEALEKRGITPMVQGFIGMTLHAAALAAMATGWNGAPLTLATIYGFTGAASSLNYAVLTRFFPPALAGRVNTSLNLPLFITAFTCQWGLGWVLDQWPRVDGHWPGQAWSMALALPAVALAVALAWQIPACRSRPSP